MKNYTYRRKNNSLLSNGFLALVKSLSGIIPSWLPANYISIVAHLSIYVALYFSYAPGLPGKSTFIVIPFLLLIHMLADKLDGLQARNTKTESALGEFVDHFFEVFNQGALGFIVWSLFDVTHDWIVPVTLSVVVLLKMAKYYEQYKANWLVTDRIGSLELKMLLMLGILLCNSGVILNLVNKPVFLDYSLVEVSLLVVALGTLINWIRTLIRIPHLTYGFWMFTAFLVLVAVVGFISFDPLLASVILLFYGGAYIGKLLMAQLIDGVERSPGLFAPIILLIQMATAYLNSTYAFIVLFIYLLANILLLIIKTFRILKDEWHWVNPKVPSDE